MTADVLAIDIATTSGFARGDVGGEPLAWSFCFATDSGSSNNSVFGQALQYLSIYLNQHPRPTVLAIEAMLPPTAMPGETSARVRDRLAGLHGVVRGVAYLRGIYRIEQATVGDIRAHFLGERNLRRDAAKRATMERCHKLGWRCEDDNQGDALALWSYTCAQIDPVQALRVSPLFNKSLRVS